MASVDKPNNTVVNQNKDKVFEDMDVDFIETVSKKNSKDEGSEEGEVSEEEEPDVIFPVPEPPTENKKLERRFDNRAGGFITGIDVFGKEEQARLIERAKRFGLDSSNTHTLSENELKKLYWSVGADEDNSDTVYRFDSLNMHGTEAMSTKDIFEYFSDYAPSSIEWLSDNSCNVIWLDNLSAVRALLGLSKPVKYPPSTTKSSDMTKTKPSATSKSPTDQDSDIIMLEETKKTKEFASEVAADPEAVDLDELGQDVPSGRWRKGKTHPHSDSILIRFARRTNGTTATEQDGRPTRLHQPVFGVVGLISTSRKEKIRKGLLVRPKLFQDDMGDERDFIISSDDEDNRNPWGTLAKSWGHIDRARKPIVYDDLIYGPRPLSPPPLPPPRHRLSPLRLPILSRVGFRAMPPRLHPGRVISGSPSFSPDRRHHSRVMSRSPPPSSERRRGISRSPSLSPERVSVKRRTAARKPRDTSSERPRRLPESRKRTRESSEKSTSESDSDEEWKKRVKVPRMRMYADEEEKRSKERSKVVNRSESSFGYTDLRSRLQLDRAGHSRGTPPPSSSHRARSPYRREDSHRRNDRESARRPVRDGASSVWLRLERPGLSSVVTKVEESDEYDLTTSSSDSESDRIVIKSTAVYANQVDDDDSDRRTSHSSRSNGKSAEKGDLRSKLRGKRTSAAPKARSPLRIEIDNDEYYRLIDTGNE